MHHNIESHFSLSVSTCLQQLYVKKLNHLAPVWLTIFVDITTSCWGNIEGITLFAKASGTAFVGLWEELSSTYVLRQTFRVEVPSPGLHSNLSLADGSIRVVPGQILAIHSLRGASGVVETAHSNMPNLAATGYTESQMSRVVYMEFYSDGLPIGKEVSVMHGNAFRRRITHRTTPTLHFCAF